ncbi:MAG TPA: sensor histidine kinase [Bryobacteraceae bacterium]|nr:sensor histidine kinase [Bryobacteraceae bacterium]
MAELLTAEGKRHIRKMLRALAPSADGLDRRFRALLRKRSWGSAESRALLAITPAAATRSGSLARFCDQVLSQGRRLAKLNAAPSNVRDALQEFGQLLERALGNRFAPAREQLQLATQFLLNDAFYQIREAEAQAFFGLFRAEAEAADLDDLLRRFVAVLAQTFRASAGRLLLHKKVLPPRLRRALYIERGQSRERLIADPHMQRRYASYWSYPLGDSAVVQLGFRTPHPWLPRERILLAAAAARCQEAIDRTHMVREIRRLEVESRRVEEDERRRIGRDLHDEAGQAMALLRLQLEMMEQDAPDSLRRRLGEARKLSARTAVELRRIIAALSPAGIDRLGVVTAIRQLAARFQRQHPAQVRLRLPASAPNLPAPVAEVAYRVAQECLQNVAKHSEATQVYVSLRASDKNLRLCVRDNGAGFRADQAWRKPASFGLSGMRERAGLFGGTLAVRSAPGKGTRIVLDIPMGRRSGELKCQRFAYC